MNLFTRAFMGMCFAALTMLSSPTFSQCGSTLLVTSSSGTITDGSGISDYSNSLNCSWLIQPGGSAPITITFTDFELETCCDYVRIYDGTSASATLLGSFNGTSLPPVVTTTGGAAYISFTTDGSVVRDGWSFDYAGCTSSFTPAIAASGSTSICAGEGVLLQTVPLAGMTYQWYLDGMDIVGATSASYMASASGNYTLFAEPNGGCGDISNAIDVQVQDNLPRASADMLSVCPGAAVQLGVVAQGSGSFSESFDPIDASLWTTNTGIVQGLCASSVGDEGLYFTSSNPRELISKSVDLSAGGDISFDLVITGSTSVGTCDDAESGEDVLLSYSLDGGSTWVVINTYSAGLNLYDVFTPITETIPVAAQGSSVMLKWEQTSNSGSGFDEWGLDNIELDVTTQSGGGTYSYAWSPAGSVSNAAIEDPLTIVTSTTTYSLNVTDLESGCDLASDVIIDVDALAIPVSVTASALSICPNGQAQLTATAGTSAIVEDFDPINSSLWGVNTGLVGATCTSTTGNPLTFGHDGTRELVSVPMNLVAGGVIEFDLWISDGSTSCDMADAGEDVQLQYSTDNGSTWQVINTYSATSGGFGNFSGVSESVPLGAQGSNVLIRWTQILHSGSSFDYFALDNIEISVAGGAQSFTYDWYTLGGGTFASTASVGVTPSGISQTYICEVGEQGSTCVGRDTVVISTDRSFAASVSADRTVVCQGDTVVLVVDGSGVDNGIEDFDPIDSGLWSSFTGNVSTGCEVGTGAGMIFNITGTREMITADLNLSGLAAIDFDMFISGTSSVCDGAESGEGVTLEYSVNGGSTWILIESYQAGQNLFNTWTAISQSLPVAAQTGSTRLKWSQPNHTGSSFDTWGIDNVNFGASSSVTATWSPSVTNIIQSGSQVWDVVNQTTTYVATVTENGTGCVATDQVSVSALSAPSKPVITTNATSLLSSYATGNQWQFNGYDLLGETQDSYNPFLAGTYTVTHSNSAGCSATSNPYTFDPILDVEAWSSAFDGLETYPNPAREELTVKFKGEGENVEIGMFDMIGNSVRSTVSYAAGLSEVSLDISGLESGQYIVKVLGDTINKTRKVVVVE